MSEYDSIIQRLEDTISSDKDLDMDISIAIGWAHNIFTDSEYRKHPYLKGVFIDDSCAGVLHNSPLYTSSLDAAIGLYLKIPSRIPSCPLKVCEDALRERNGWF